MTKKVLVTLGLLLLVCGMVFAAGAQEKKAEGFVVGISNNWVGSEWRTQMVDETLLEAEKYKAEGIISEVIVQSTDVSLEGQIDQIRNLMARGCDIILVNPADARAFNPVFAEAKKQGITIVATDTEVASPDTVNVAINQKVWAMTSSQWLADKLNHKGNVVAINGVTGHPANTARMSGYQEVFGKYPGIKILNEVSGEWDSAIGMSAMQDMLATFPNINGVWVQDGMTEGVFSALQNAGRDDIVCVGEARVGFMRRWKEQGLDTIGVANPPACMASALHVAVLLAQGRELKEGILEGPYGNTIYLPIPVVVTNENFDEVWNEYKDKPDYFAVDGKISRATAESYFK
ncbi:MAG: ABC transporter substrate-binding protein [Sphaerochaetaceae bacterium]|jgi:ribose transport system substrate-binding protein|nr:ABC transporter substrate-binding protein [Sphaerochaetaceae bacterium]MDD4219615.1 ABC transporter substrate-binding protein [Sphaerochaetaceae bacterium]MDY0371852.1 ABC transporter substrate-binding protein [Sphaerochaetaceae bacterium]